MGLIDGAFLFFRIVIHFIYCYFEAFVHVFKPPSRKSIEGEIILITGGGHGIGRQLALDFSALGAVIVIWDINQKNNEGVAEEINKAGGKAFAYKCDVSDSSEIAKVAAKVREDVGDVTMLVNNAGIVNGDYFTELEEKDIRRIFNINVLSHFWMDKEFLPSMIEKNHGHIVNTSSMAGLLPCPVLSDYCATKFAVIGLGDSIGLELGVKGITGVKVSNVCPMFADTGFVDEYYNALAPKLLTPEEVSRVAVDGVLRNYETITVPTNMFYMHKFLSLLPRKAQKFLIRFKLLSLSPQYKKSK